MAIKLAKAQAETVLRKLKKNYPDAHCALVYENPFQLLLATILSAQCTDERVNLVTPYLFSKYPSPEAMASAVQNEVEEIIHSTGFYKNKAKSLIGAAQMLVDKYNSQIPQDLEKLTELPGVGRKTANVVLGNCFGLATGVVVDTHVGRLSQRLGWTKFASPLSIEQDLIKLFKPQEWVMLSHYLIFHGRLVCKARSPKCEECFLFDLCPKNKVK